MHIIKEFWEFQKNIHSEVKFQKDSKKELLGFIDSLEKFDGKWVQTILDEDIYIKEIEDGIYYGHDKDGNDVTGELSNIKNILT